MHYYQKSVQDLNTPTGLEKKKDQSQLNARKEEKHTLKTLFMTSMSLKSSPVPRDAPKACLIHVVRNECNITSFVKS